MPSLIPSCCNARNVPLPLRGTWDRMSASRRVACGYPIYSLAIKHLASLPGAIRDRYDQCHTHLCSSVARRHDAR